MRDDPLSIRKGQNLAGSERHHWQPPNPVGNPITQGSPTAADPGASSGQEGEGTYKDLANPMMRRKDGPITELVSHREGPSW